MHSIAESIYDLVSLKNHSIIKKNTFYPFTKQTNIKM